MSLAIGAEGLLPHYRPDGDLYDQLSRVIYTLEPTYIRSALYVCSVVFNADKRGELDDPDRAEALTNRAIRRRIEEETGHRFSLSFVKKGLYALHHVLGKRKDENGKSLALIDRIRQHGRRIIVLMRGIRESGKARMLKPGEPIVPLCTPPPEKREDQETATTGEASSPSLASLPGTGPELPEDLGDAVGLVPDLSRERLAGWVWEFGVEIAPRMVAWLRICLCNPRREDRPQGAFWAEKAGRSWKKRLEANFITLADIDQQIAAKVKKWGPKPAAAAAAPKEDPAEKAKEEAKDRRIREAWGLLSKSDQGAIRAKVRAETPGFDRLPEMMREALCLAELGKRMEPAEPRAP